MKSRPLLLILELSAFLAMSACMQPESMRSEELRRQSAGPLAVDGDRSKNPGEACRRPQADALLGKIGEGAEALFQILKTDPEDLGTMHERAARLGELEQEYLDGFFATNCSPSDRTSENMLLRIEKLGVLAKETDAAIIRALASQLWNIYNSNLEIRDDSGGTSTGNPFAEPSP